MNKLTLTIIFFFIFIILGIGVWTELTEESVRPRCSEFCGQLNLSYIELNNICICEQSELNCYPSQTGSLYLICGGKNETIRLS